MVNKYIKHIMSCLLFGSLISNSNQFNLDIFMTRKNIIQNSLSSIGLIKLNANNLISNENNENNQDNEEKVDSSQIEMYNLFQNKKPKFMNNDIYFSGSLDEESCFSLTETLLAHKNMALTNQDYPNHINLYIQSPGGSLLPTLAVVDEIKNLGIPVYTYIRGYAASAATLLSVVATRRYMYNHSVMMVHGVKLGEQSVGSLLDVKDLNTNVDVFMNIVKRIYLENTNINEKILEELFFHDIWINSTLALKYGFIDEIL